MHEPVAVPEIAHIEKPVYRRIAIALDFSKADIKLIAYAIGQAQPFTTFVLIHVVESASAKILGSETDDFETRKDAEKLQAYAARLEEQGYKTTTLLGFRNRTKEIIRIVKESQADMLVIGAHGHSGMKDWLYGATINAVRHGLQIPVLIVHT